MRFSTLAFSALLMIGLVVSCGSDSANRDPDDSGGEGGADGGTEAKSVQKVIGPDGGELSIDGATLTLPPGALSANTEITLERMSDADAALLAGMPAGISARSQPVAMMPHGLTFDAPVQVALGFEGTNASSLAAGRLSDPNDDAWEKAGQNNQYKDGRATFTISSFSIYAIVDDPEGHLGGDVGAAETGGTTSAGGSTSSVGGTTSAGGAPSAGGVSPAGGAQTAGAAN